MKKSLIIISLLVVSLLCGCESSQERAVRKMREANEAYQDSLWELEQTKKELERVQMQIEILEGMD